MQTENRKAIETLTKAFEQVAERARANRWPADVVADAAFRTSLSLIMEQHGVRGVAEQCRRLAVAFGQFADAVDGDERRAA